MPFANIIRNAFNSIIERASEDVPILSNRQIWREVRQIVFDSSIDRLENDELFNFLLRLDPLFVSRDCRNKALMTYMFYLVARQRAENYPDFTQYYMKKRFYDIIRPCEVPERLPTHISGDFKKIFSKPYKEAKVFYVMGDSVTNTAVAGDIFLLQLLLKFGATMIQPREEHLPWGYCELVVQNLFSNVSALHIDTSLSTNFSQTSKRRLYFVLLCLEVLIRLKSPPSPYNYIASFQHLFKAIPEPLVTTKEISCCLEKILRGLQKDEEIQTVVNEFGNFFPESLQLPGPRSLKHLGRIQVRENLRKAFPFRLPQAVASLPIPTELKNYILLTDADFV